MIYSLLLNNTHSTDERFNMENNTNNNSNKKAGISIGSLVFLIILIVCAFSIYVKPAMDVPKDAIAHVKQYVVTSLGVTPEKFDTDTIYKSGKDKIIVVKYALDNGDYDGSVALYYRDNQYMSATRIMNAEYNWNEEIETLKAIFGIY